MMTYTPPKIYRIYTPSAGGYFMAACYVSDFRVDSIGTTREMKQDGFGSQSILIPEAYKVSITFTDLVSQSSNIFAGTMGAEKVQVISEINEKALNETDEVAGNERNKPVAGSSPQTPPKELTPTNYDVTYKKDEQTGIIMDTRETIGAPVVGSTDGTLRTQR